MLWNIRFAQWPAGDRSEIASALSDALGAAPRCDAGAPVLFFVAAPSAEACETIQEISRSGLDRVLVVLPSRCSSASGAAWSLLRAGASDVLTWDDGVGACRRIAARLQRWATIDAVVASPMVRKNLVGTSRAWIASLREIAEIASLSEAPALILGESGTGKELAARLVHSLDPRPVKGQLVVVDCTTIVPELSGSEFFGHEKGAFTGAAGARDGAFALADGGTLFLDEIGELPLELQAQLLRVVQEQTYKRVGGNTWHKASFRLVCATNRDLLREVERGGFRRDLYYRIASASTRLPPLRERAEDILPLVRHFMRAIRPDVEPPDLDEDVRDQLLRRAYPGNVRDLRQLVARMMYRYVPPGPLTIGALPDEERPAVGEEGGWRDANLEGAVRHAIALGAGLKDIGRRAEDMAVRIAVEDEEGNLQRAANRLGVTDRALQLRRAAGRR
jgi:transcriptional regulator with GAF, ATPase, and Fis domain